MKAFSRVLGVGSTTLVRILDFGSAWAWGRGRKETRPTPTHGLSLFLESWNTHWNNIFGEPYVKSYKGMLRTKYTFKYSQRSKFGLDHISRCGQQS